MFKVPKGQLQNKPTSHQIQNGGLLMPHTTLSRDNGPHYVNSDNSLLVLFATLRINSLNPSNPNSDLDRISPYTIGTIWRRQVIRIKKNIN